MDQCICNVARVSIHIAQDTMLEFLIQRYAVVSHFSHSVWLPFSLDALTLYRQNASQSKPINAVGMTALLYSVTASQTLLLRTTSSDQKLVGIYLIIDHHISSLSRQGSVCHRKAKMAIS
jgi:hypothetical protein